MKLAKELTAIYIRLCRTPKHQAVSDELLTYIREALIIAQKRLTHEQFKQYTKWHKQLYKFDW